MLPLTPGTPWSPGAPFKPGKPGSPASPREPAVALKTSPGMPFCPASPGAPGFPVRPGCPCSPGSPFRPLSPRGPVKPRNKTGIRHHSIHYRCCSANPRYTRCVGKSRGNDPSQGTNANFFKLLINHCQYACLPPCRWMTVREQVPIPTDDGRKTGKLDLIVSNASTLSSI